MLKFYHIDRCKENIYTENEIQEILLIHKFSTDKLSGYTFFTCLFHGQHP